MGHEHGSLPAQPKCHVCAVVCSAFRQASQVPRGAWAALGGSHARAPLVPNPRQAALAPHVRISGTRLQLDAWGLLDAASHMPLPNNAVHSESTHKTAIVQNNTIHSEFIYSAH